MKTSTVLGIVLAVLFSFAGVATAAGYLWAQADSDHPPAARALPAQWPSNGGTALRPVPMPTGEMVTALPPDTAGQVLCQSLSLARWEALLGGKALREVRGADCHIVTTTTDITLALDSGPANLQEPRETEVAGHTAQLEYLPPKVSSRLDVRLADAPGSSQIKPYLRVELRGDAPALDTLAESIASEVVAATTKPGPALPPVRENGSIPLERPAPTAIADLPLPMISWQLCAALTRELGGTARPYIDGRCMVRGVQAAYTDTVSPRAFPLSLAGRPALITDNLVAVRLTDGTSQELAFTGDRRSLEKIARAVLPRLLGH
ncbi:hypothetical protein [Amycolatopsis alkalitolerans]|uniref:DUF5642 domain-containing protein n=1 Tax=Amycolatopsis alkalitolerans TaxID=2547244 RepID=A0A5C4M9W9_9PSEU|nr:hypothetical protein [Amycolatopsis alkalitolerans]TNC28164.1 hypothetical protein FG385_06995 [Amycolatopsis alkalitolerans]